jgi:hypothetical protein
VNTDSCYRSFEGRHRVIERLNDAHNREPIEVYFARMQFPDGSIKPEIVVHQSHADDPIHSTATARQLARAIMEAADEMDKLELDDDD